MYLSGENEERQQADELIDILLFKKLTKGYEEKIFLKPATPNQCNGNYFLGMVIYPPDKFYCKFGIKEHEWIMHLLIVGITGSGKTNLTFQILKELRRNNKPFMVFDWKNNYRDLIQLPEFKNIKVYTVAKDISPFKFNPLIPPPNIKPGHWLMKIVDVIKHAYFVGEGVEYILRDSIDKVYEYCGYYNQNQEKQNPTFQKVKDFVYKKRLDGRMGLWKASSMRVLESLCFRHGLGSVVNTDNIEPRENIKGTYYKKTELNKNIITAKTSKNTKNTEWEFDKELLNHDVILELDALSDVDKIFLTEAIILWIYEYRKQEGKRETFKHSLILDEAHKILSEQKEKSEGTETIMETCLRQIREFGESVIIIDQEPSKLSNSIKANTYCKITFNLGNGKDIQNISECMSLTKEESDCIDLLEVGHGIVSMKGRVNVPLHVVFPKSEVKKGLISDDDIKRNNGI